MQEINSLKDHPEKAKFIIPNLPDGFLGILSEAQQALKTWGQTVDLQIEKSKTNQANPADAKNGAAD